MSTWHRPKWKRDWNKKPGGENLRKKGKGSRKIMEGLQELIDERIRRKKKPGLSPGMTTGRMP
jgi:hypothetical protein